MPQLLDIHQVRNRTDPAPKWRWIAVMPELSRINRIGSLSAFSLPPGYVEILNAPHRRTDTEGRFGGGIRTYYPRFSDIDSTTITFYEDELYNATAYLRTWEKLVKDNNNNYGLPSTYKYTIEIFAFTNTNNRQEAYHHRLLGCWPTGIEATAWDYQSSEKVEVTANFSVDDEEVRRYIRR